MMEFRRKFTIFLVAVAAVIMAVPSANAVTKEEMDRARAVTAQWYLRWVNNGSDYLDNLNPQSMADLESKLKEKEKENIKAFKSVSTPSDYASWDKEKVVEYWSSTFFKSSGLNEKGRGAKARVKKKLSALNFTDPADTPKEEPKPAGETNQENAEAAATQETSPEAEAAADGQTMAEPEVPTAEEIMDQSNAEDSASVAEDTAAKSENDSSTYTWLYVVALIVLVGVVIWLVVFASKTMQNSSRAAKDIEDAEEEERRRETRRAERQSERREAASTRRQEGDEEVNASAETAGIKNDNSLREKFARSLTMKDEEIRSLNRQIHSLREECMRLGEENVRLNADLKRTKRELLALKSMSDEAVAEAEVEEEVDAEEQEEMPAPRRRAGRAARSEEKEARKDSQPSASNRENPAREIYLGRVNAKGIFVRADRKPVEGKSVFVLSTSDSYTGTFRVLQAGATIDMALDNPEYYLAGGCVAKDITDTAEADGIQTLASGTAVFEDGCWRVLRKAKIAYE